jgi:glycosyltransferase involved in cell wall biosynthesis
METGRHKIDQEAVKAGIIGASVVIATYNRADRLQACLHSLSRQTQLQDDFEVVVVVDGSTDGTLEMLNSFKVLKNLRVVEQQNSGQPSALNHGASTASGNLLIFLDDDFIAGPDLIAEHIRLHREHERVVGIGQMSLSVPDHAHWFLHYYAKDWAMQYEELNQESRPPGWQDCYGCNMSVSRDIYSAVGGNDVSLDRGYDLDLAYRLERYGCKFVYLPKAMGELDERKDFHALAKDLEKSGASSVELYRRFPPALPDLIGFFATYPLSWVFLWRLFLRIGLSPLLLDRLGIIIRDRVNTPNWYRFLERYCFWRGVSKASPSRRFWEDLTYGVPILLYHAFGAPGELPSRYIIPARRFARQMAWLKRTGYQVISLEEYLRYRWDFRLPPHRSIVLTIDDGYRDSWTLAYPILRRYEFPATIFLVSGQIGKAYHVRNESELDGRPMLEWEEITTMARNGITIGSHTRTHTDLTSLPSRLAAEEIEGSKADIEFELGRPVTVFAYPFGIHDPTIQALAQEAGFLGSCGIDSGRNTPITPLHNLRRVEVYGTDTIIEFVLAAYFGESVAALKERFRSFSNQIRHTFSFRWSKND